MGDVRDQPVEPLHVVLDHREQARAALLAARERQGLDRGAQRGQRILELVRDVGGKAFDRLDAAVERRRHVAQRAGQVADLVAPAGEVGNFHARPDAPAHVLGRGRESPHRPRDRARQQHREHHHDGGDPEEHLEDLDPLGLDALIDVAALRRQQQRAAHRMETLHRHRDRDDGPSALVDAHHARVYAAQRADHLRIAFAVIRSELLVARQAAAREPAAHRVHAALDQAGLFGAGRRQLEAQYVATAAEIAAVEDERAIRAVDARTRVGRQHETAQQRRHALRIDGEFVAVQQVVRRPVAFAGLQLEQAIRVDRERIVLHRRGARDGARDHLALYAQAARARLDQPGAQLGELENADHQHHQAREVENDDAAGEAREALRDEDLPGVAGDAGQPLRAQHVPARAEEFEGLPAGAHRRCRRAVAPQREKRGGAPPDTRTTARSAARGRLGDAVRFLRESIEHPCVPGSRRLRPARSVGPILAYVCPGRLRLRMRGAAHCRQRYSLKR